MTDMIEKTPTPVDIEDAAQALREVGDICPGCARAADLLEQLHKTNQELAKTVSETNTAARYFLDMAEQVDALWIDHLGLVTKPDRTPAEAEQLAWVMFQIHRLGALRRAAQKLP